MIYGAQTHSINKDIVNSISKLGKLMEWSNSIHHKIEFENFYGGFLYDKNLPYNIKDFCTISDDRKILILLSGNIYNKEKIIFENNLVEEISLPEIILFIYLKNGTKFVDLLNGDFSIYIYDLFAKKSFLFRDHVGIKPLVYNLSEKDLWFSSDILSLSKLLYGNEPLDYSFIQKLLTIYGLQSQSLLPEFNVTPNRNIKRVLPGHYIELRSGATNVIDIKYWNPDKNVNRNLYYCDSLDNFAHLLNDSIRIRCDKRFIAAAHLSGGIDSATIAVKVRSEYFKEQNQFYGFSWTPSIVTEDKLDFNEQILIKSICSKANIQPCFIDLTVEEFIDFLSESRYICDILYEPKVRKIAKEKKINLIFSGYGGDEFVSIDNIGIDSDLIFNLKLASFIKKNSPIKLKKLIKVILSNVILPALKLKYFTHKKTINAYSKYLLNNNKHKVKTINDLYNWRSRNDIHKKYLYNYHLQDRIEDWTING